MRATLFARYNVLFLMLSLFQIQIITIHYLSYITTEILFNSLILPINESLKPENFVYHKVIYFNSYKRNCTTHVINTMQKSDGLIN